MQYFGRKTQKVTFLSVPEKKAHVLFSGMMTAVVAIFVLAAFFSDGGTCICRQL